MTTTITNYKKELSDAREKCFSIEAVRTDPLLSIHEFVQFTDLILIKVFEQHLQNDISSVCLVALGGYGREELCPFSDIDLLILHEGDHTDEKIARLVRALWDMGFPLGCVVRSISECKRILGEDLASDTALLDTRYLAGSKQLFRRLVHKVIEPYFRRRTKWFTNEMNVALRQGIFAPDTSLYMVEPNLKSGICTLRDCQRIVWGTRVSDGKYIVHDLHKHHSFEPLNKSKFIDAYKALLQYRCALHMISGRRLDVLEFSQQQSVAEFLGFGSDGAGTFMEHFFKVLYDIKQILMLFLERQQTQNLLIQKLRRYLSGISVGTGIKLLDGILSPSGVVPPPGIDPIRWILEIYKLSINYQAFPGTLLENRIRVIAEEFHGKNCASIVINQQFIKLLSAVTPLGRIVKSMYETGFLSVLLPEINSIKCKVEYDSYHEFTVDQHSLLAFSLIDDLAKDPDHQVQMIFKGLGELFTLRMAVLLHDMGKSVEGNHSYTGSVIAMNVSDRLGIEEAQSEIIAFLIQHHLELSLLAFQREPEEHIIAAFAEKMQDCRRLDLLYLLTIVDIRSVGRKTWTVWKGMQLQSVYERVRFYLIDKSTDRKTRSLLKSEKKTNESLYTELLERVSDSTTIEIAVEKFPGFERLIIGGFDRPHFFADIVGCLSSEGYNILSAQIATTNGKALDVFHVEPDSTIRLPSSQRVQNITRKWSKIVSGSITTDKLIEERMRLYPAKAQRISNEKDTEILIDNALSKDYSVLELKTPDRLGLLYQVAQCLSKCDVNIISAKLSTRVSKAIDIFYINGVDGKKITDSVVRERIQQSLLDLLSKNW